MTVVDGLMPVINMRTGVSILSQLHISIEISGEKVSYSDISGLSFSHHNVVRSVKIKSTDNVWPLPTIASSDPETEKGDLRFMMYLFLWFHSKETES